MWASTGDHVIQYLRSCEPVLEITWANAWDHVTQYWRSCDPVLEIMWPNTGDHVIHVCVIHGNGVPSCMLSHPDKRCYKDEQTLLKEICLSLTSTMRLTLSFQHPGTDTQILNRRSTVTANWLGNGYTYMYQLHGQRRLEAGNWWRAIVQLVWCEWCNHAGCYSGP